jgi:hypothetical protein
VVTVPKSEVEKEEAKEKLREPQASRETQGRKETLTAKNQKADLGIGLPASSPPLRRGVKFNAVARSSQDLVRHQRD